MTLAIDIRSHDTKTAVLTVTGQLNAMSSADLRTALTDVLEGRQNRIVLELSALDFIDSSGLGAVIGGLKSARLAGGDLRLVAPGPQVTMILRLTNLDQILPTYTSVDAAAADDDS